MEERARRKLSEDEFRTLRSRPFWKNLNDLQRELLLQALSLLRTRSEAAGNKMHFLPDGEGVRFVNRETGDVLHTRLWSDLLVIYHII